MGQWDASPASRYLVPQALVFLAVGVWLLLRTNVPGASLIRGLWTALRGAGPLSAALLLPVLVGWLGLPGVVPRAPSLVLAALGLFCAAVVTVLLAPRVASIVAMSGLTAYAVYGIAVMMFGVPAGFYGVVTVTDGHRAVAAGVEGVILAFMAWRLWPRVLADSPERVLSRRVQRLTQTRSDATDSATAELKRIERDLHDGAQARLVALGMALRSAEKLMLTSPEAALALVTEARETSSRALTDLRDLVRGIYPPVLADRGLADALRSLALDAPLPPRARARARRPAARARTVWHCAYSSPLGVALCWLPSG
jgi:signal transduction histidine kinase